MLLQDICDFLDEFAPIELAEDWDNVGLLTGNRHSDVNKIMTCLTITPSTASEAIAAGADLIVTHHPLPFRPLKRITTDQTATKLLWQLIQNNVSIYSPHTAFDSAANGINQSVCQRIGVTNITPLQSKPLRADGLGAGRMGTYEQPLELNQLIDRLKQIYNINQLRYVGQSDAKIRNVASACGSGGSFLSAAVKQGCDTLITGEADFHSCLEAQAQNLTLILLGHYNSERFAVEMLADHLQGSLSSLTVWAAQQEEDPIRSA